MKVTIQAPFSKTCRESRRVRARPARTPTPVRFETVSGNASGQTPADKRSGKALPSPAFCCYEGPVAPTRSNSANVQGDKKHALSAHHAARPQSRQRAQI